MESILAVAYDYEKTLIWKVTEDQIQRIAGLLAADPVNGWDRCLPILGDYLYATNNTDPQIQQAAEHYEANNDYYLSFTEGPDTVLECLADWGFEDTGGTDLPEGSAARFGKLLD